MSQSDTVSVETPEPFCRNREAKNKVTYLSQVLVIYTIILVAIVHLSLQSPDKELWLVLLSSSLGYILPTPGLKFLKPTQ